MVMLLFGASVVNDGSDRLPFVQRIASFIEAGERLRISRTAQAGSCLGHPAAAGGFRRQQMSYRISVGEGEPERTRRASIIDLRAPKRGFLLRVHAGSRTVS
ncbi:hypothetical protein LGM65_12420 [Burkholderia anthina]|uniref:hypothetical protein n=1 Tax=Burkholderia anthina TaxID=179879 RepID=UPI001CF35DF4|nr:hypothetical protein [Burkholderia anthina]MCA8091692.1 hypothetical protein [Burkholderia anthina]